MTPFGACSIHHQLSVANARALNMHTRSSPEQLLAPSACSTVPPNFQSPSEPAESKFTIKNHGRQVDVENSLLPERQRRKRAGSPPRFSEARLRTPLCLEMALVKR